jgi:hypothetical protein
MMIFISHSSHDDPFVEWVRKELRARGYRTWVDHVDIPAGKLWDEVVEEKLGQCQIMILVISPDGMASQEVGIEWREFRSRGKTILPVKLTDCPVPLLLRHIQHIDFTDSAQRSKQLQRLLDQLPPPPRTVTRNLEGLDTREMQVIELRQKAEDLQRTLVGDNQILFAFLELEKISVFDLDKEKLFIGWYDRKTGLKPDIDLTRFDAFGHGVSRQHALLEKTSSGLMITDLSSMNGTFIGEKMLSPMLPTPLQNDSIVRIGSLIVRVFFREMAHKTL